jgi:hypothetical protein
MTSRIRLRFMASLSQQVAPTEPYYTIDASGFVNAFTPHKPGHAESLSSSPRFRNTQTL